MKWILEIKEFISENYPQLILMIICFILMILGITGIMAGTEYGILK